MILFVVGCVVGAIPSINDDTIVTVDPGVHRFAESGFQENLAQWIIDHPDHEVVSICPARPTGYFVLTRVKPEFLNYVLPGQANPNGGEQ